LNPPLVDWTMPVTVNLKAGVLVPMPMLPVFSVITEFPITFVPVHLVMLPTVPLPVTCAGAVLIANKTKMQVVNLRRVDRK
jgi:hypothetical protein